MYNNTEMSDYSYLKLRISTFAAGKAPESGIVFGDAPDISASENPLGLFVNAYEVICLINTGNYNVVQLWKQDNDSSVTVASLAIKKNCIVKAQSVLRLLRECVLKPELTATELFEVYGFTPNPQLCECSATGSATKSMALRTFTSTSALNEIISSRLIGGDCDVAKLVIADATAVAVVEEDELPHLRQPVVPDFGIEIVQKPASAPKPSLKSYYYTDETDEDAEEKSEPTPRRQKKRNNAAISVLLVVFALAIGWSIVRCMPELLPSSTSYDNIESTDVSELHANIAAIEVADSLPANFIAADSLTVTVADTTATVEGVAENSQISDEAEDLEYLNSNRIWNRSQLKSEKYKEFFDLFAEGDLYKIADSDFFAVEGLCTNKTAEKAVKLIWQAYKTPTHLSNRRELRKLKGKEEIDLRKLVNTLALYRDSKPNTSSRPKR